MSDKLPDNLRPIADFFGLAGTAPVEKDFYVVRAIQALITLDAAPFRFVFGGGTALARAHKLMRRMSEDVDFKVVALPSAPVGRSALHRERRALRDRVTTALLAAGFSFDPEDPSQIKSRDESRYTIYQLPYRQQMPKKEEGLRPTIQIELKHTTLRREPTVLPVSSFVSEAMKLPPDVPGIACVSVTETAAEKLVSLTRRTAMDLAGANRDPDPALVRHIYDLHMMRERIDATLVGALARDIASKDAQEFRNQYPAYETDAAGETRKALDALRNDSLYQRRYEDFLAAMVYGERPGFKEALATVMNLADVALIGT